MSIDQIANPAGDEIAQQLLARGLAAGRSARLQVRGHSMGPLIRDGDRVTVLPLAEAVMDNAVLDQAVMDQAVMDNDELDKAALAQTVLGQVVLARSRTGNLVCHRVLDQSGSRFWLAGDHSSIVERHDAGSILGFVASVDRDGTVQRLGGRWTSLLDRLEAHLHLFAIHHRGSWTGRARDAIRRTILALRSLAALGC